MSADPLDSEIEPVAHIHVRKPDLGSPGRAPVFHVFEELYSRSLRPVDASPPWQSKAGQAAPHKTRRRRGNGGEG